MLSSREAQLLLDRRIVAGRLRGQYTVPLRVFRIVAKATTRSDDYRSRAVHSSPFLYCDRFVEFRKTITEHSLTVDISVHRAWLLSNV